jgi:hypothetical protein
VLAPRLALAKISFFWKPAPVSVTCKSALPFLLLVICTVLVTLPAWRSDARSMRSTLRALGSAREPRSGRSSPCAALRFGVRFGV